MTWRGGPAANRGSRFQALSENNGVAADFHNQRIITNENASAYNRIRDAGRRHHAGYAVLWFLVNDRLKLLAYRIFDPDKVKSKPEANPEAEVDSKTESKTKSRSDLTAQIAKRIRKN
jgi:hypothetical protein